jgi:L,D-peptidoglycan transpeptidase YkuD (ErfK/YbiS/YcfS/YnhG family)
MDLTVDFDGKVWRLGTPEGRVWQCAIGWGGLTSAKGEGDGATPVGCWPLRRVLYRPDRVDPPRTALPVAPLDPNDGWCDDPAHPDYNRPVRLPFAAGHEVMWRTDHLYDIVVILGHNDDPPVPGAGSAIFFHVAAPDYAPTAGCVAVALPDLLTVLADAGPGDRICIPAPA